MLTSTILTLIGLVLLILSKKNFFKNHKGFLYWSGISIVFLSGCIVFVKNFWIE